MGVAPEDLSADAGHFFNLCLACRRCESLCPSFDLVFDRQGWPPDGDAGAVGALDRFAALCYQCGLCLERCPYGPLARPEIGVDIPRLVLRSRIARARRSGLRSRDRLFANADLVGAVGTLASPVVNRLLRSRLARGLLERATGVDRNLPLAPFSRQAMDRWFRKRERRLRKRATGEAGRTVLFLGCAVNYRSPGIGRSAVSVLVAHGVRVACPDQRCCGRRHLEIGDLDGALENLRFNVRALRRYASEGWSIVSMQPACTRMLASDYPWLEPGEATQAVASATIDLVAHLLALIRSGTLPRPPRAGPLIGPLRIHASCAARTIGAKGWDLLGELPGLDAVSVEGCPRRGDAAGENRGSPHEEAQTGRIVSECVDGSHRLRQATGGPAVHPVEILRELYGLREDV